MSDKASPKRAAASHEKPPVDPTALSKRDWLLAAGLVIVLCAIYLFDGTFLIGNDVKGTINLPQNLIKFGSFGFTPSRSPFMFAWAYRAANGGIGHGEIQSWDMSLDQVPAAELFRSGRLKAIGEGYFLIPSIRIDRQTGEQVFVNTFGPGAALTATPFFAVMSAFVGDLSAQPWYLWYGGKFVAAFLVSCSAAIVFLTARQFIEMRPALLIALAFGVGTSVWSVSSQTLWQHGPNEFFLTLGTYFLIRSKFGGAQAAGSGLAYACAVACRPDSIVFVLSATIYLLLVDRRALLRFVLAALPVALLLGAYNAYYLGSPFTFGQSQAGAMIAQMKTGSSRIWQTPLHVGLAGVLISPGRGMLVYSPFLIFAGVGGYACWRDRRFAPLRVLTIAVVLMIMIESLHYDWWGGWSWSYRKIVDTTPALALLLVPVIRVILARRGLLAIFSLLLIWSVAMQILGAFSFDVGGWNNRLVAVELVPVGQNKSIVESDLSAANAQIRSGSAQLVRKIEADVDRAENRWRLWSWSDNPIVYYLVNFSDSRTTRIEDAAKWTKGNSGSNRD